MSKCSNSFTSSISFGFLKCHFKLAIFLICCRRLKATSGKRTTKRKTQQNPNEARDPYQQKASSGDSHLSRSVGDIPNIIRSKPRVVKTILPSSSKRLAIKAITRRSCFVLQASLNNWKALKPIVEYTNLFAQNLPMHKQGFETSLKCQNFYPYGVSAPRSVSRLGPCPISTPAIEAIESSKNVWQCQQRTRYRPQDQTPAGR